MDDARCDHTANGPTPTGAGVFTFGSASTVTISTDSYICDNNPLVSRCDGLSDTSRCFAVCLA